MRYRPRHFARFFGALREGLMNASGTEPARNDEQADRIATTLVELERLKVAGLNQAEQMFQFDVLNAESRASREALRFLDVLLIALLAIQIIAALLLLGRPDPNAVAIFVLLGVGAVLVCWGLTVTSWPDDENPVDAVFVSELATDPANARAGAAVKAAGLAKRNDKRRTLKSRVFVIALLLTVADVAWVGATHAPQLATAPASAASPSPSPSPSPTASPAPTPSPARATPRPRPRGKARGGKR
jgi:xanthosine utilization system XapX-like protein